MELFVTVNIYTNGVTFQRVKNAYVRCCVAEHKGFNPRHVLAHYPLDGNISTRGLVFCRFKRMGQGWAVEALGWGCGGGMATDPACMDVVMGRQQPI
jgi:stress response protein SCP2